ncbi:hypothetical protein [Pyxidicoccus xibeiensis]|uniref:hypothetical protein n=1 Tax=Pyxidicoccus xibeiensis TaxID=2906759 RepID=UPI0020A72518|nr:hypothetical protein [Pyxidicoccus xibeiensis]MCP3142530.1 hypothetical protein [Pyxidicoccus xibeiensis]
MSGPYLSDAYGQVEFRMEGERVIGTGTGGACGFKSDTRLISGEFQDNVLVGTVLLCQVGPECEARVEYPMLALFNPQDRVLSALVRLAPGCGSSALKGGSLLILRATSPLPDAREAAAPAADEAEPLEVDAPPAPETMTGSVVQARGRLPDASSEGGSRQPAAGESKAAQAVVQGVVERDARSPSAMVGLAASQLSKNDIEGALRSLGSVKSSTRPDVHLWTAYAHHREGTNHGRCRESLRRAMELGWAPRNRPAEAVPERALHEEIRSLMQQGRKRAASREPTGSGSTSP